MTTHTACKVLQSIAYVHWVRSINTIKIILAKTGIVVGFTIYLNLAGSMNNTHHIC